MSRGFEMRDSTVNIYCQNARILRCDNISTDESSEFMVNSKHQPDTREM